MKSAMVGVGAGLSAMLALVSIAPVAAQPKAPRIEAGVLNCRVAGGTGFIVGSTRNLNCVWSMPGGRRERYFGVINRFGIDVGSTVESQISWAVLASTSRYGPGALAGTFAGVGAEASVGMGLGANVLVGGSASGIALQPLSVQAQKGVNIAAGIAALELRLDD
jgi:hypothetical protein